MGSRTPISAALAALLTLVLGATVAAGNGAGGVTGPAFYVDGVLYRTVTTPTDLSHTGAPPHSFDIIYAIDDQPNVATAAPGDRDYNGGRWMVHALTFSDYSAAVAAVDDNASGDIDSEQEVEAARAGGFITSDTVVRQFVCPVIKVPRGRA